jgi:hypothetical protein
MKNIIVTNRVMMGITLVLYITIVYGLMFQLLLGFFQLISGLCFLFFWKRLSKHIQSAMLLYYMVSLVYLAIYFSGLFDIWDNWFFVIVIPYGIAIYFTYILETIQRKRGSTFGLKKTV